MSATNPLQTPNETVHPAKAYTITSPWTRRRLNRLDFFVQSFFLYFLLLAGTLELANLVQLAFVEPDQLNPMITSIFGYGLFFIIWGMHVINRLHDFNLPGWLCPLILVPVINKFFVFALLVIPGTNQANRYGPPSPPLTKSQSILVFLFIIEVSILVYYFRPDISINELIAWILRY